jgi:hypothetical protein
LTASPVVGRTGTVRISTRRYWHIQFGIVCVIVPERMCTLDSSNRLDPWEGLKPIAIQPKEEAETIEV